MIHLKQFRALIFAVFLVNACKFNQEGNKSNAGKADPLDQIELMEDQTGVIFLSLPRLEKEGLVSNALINVISCTQEYCISEFPNRLTHKIYNLGNDTVDITIRICELDTDSPELESADCGDELIYQGVDVSKADPLDYADIEAKLVRAELTEQLDTNVSYYDALSDSINQCSIEHYKENGIELSEEDMADIDEVLDEAEVVLNLPGSYYLDHMNPSTNANPLDQAQLALASQNEYSTRNLNKNHNLSLTADEESNYGIDPEADYEVVTSYYRPILDVDFNTDSIPFFLSGLIPGGGVISNGNLVTLNGTLVYKNVGSLIEKIKDYKDGRKTKSKTVEAIAEVVGLAAQAVGRGGSAVSAAGDAGDATNKGAEDTNAKDSATANKADEDEKEKTKKGAEAANAINSASRPAAGLTVDSKAAERDKVKGGWYHRVTQGARKVAEGAVTGVTRATAGDGIIVGKATTGLVDAYGRARTGGARVSQGGNIKVDALTLGAFAGTAAASAHPLAAANAALEALDIATDIGKTAVGAQQTILYEIRKDGQTVHSYSYPPSSEIPGTGTREELDTIYDNNAVSRMTRKRKIKGKEYLEKQKAQIASGSQKNNSAMLEMQGQRARFSETSAEVTNGLDTSSFDAQEEEVAAGDEKALKERKKAKEKYQSKATSLLAVAAGDSDHHRKLNEPWLRDDPQLQKAYRETAGLTAVVLDANKEGFAFSANEDEDLKRVRAYPSDKQQLEETNLSAKHLAAKIANSTATGNQAKIIEHHQKLLKDPSFRDALSDERSEKMYESGARVNQLKQDIHPVNQFGIASKPAEFTKLRGCTAAACSVIESTVSTAPGKKMEQDIIKERANVRSLYQAAKASEKKREPGQSKAEARAAYRERKDDKPEQKWFEAKLDGTTGQARVNLGRRARVSAKIPLGAPIAIAKVAQRLRQKRKNTKNEKYQRENPVEVDETPVKGKKKETSSAPPKETQKTIKESQPKASGTTAHQRAKSEVPIPTFRTVVSSKKEDGPIYNDSVKAAEISKISPKKKTRKKVNRINPKTRKPKKNISQPAPRDSSAGVKKTIPLGAEKSKAELATQAKERAKEEAKEEAKEKAKERAKSKLRLVDEGEGQENADELELEENPELCKQNPLALIYLIELSRETINMTKSEINLLEQSL